jgi:hypothetical protein
MKRNMLIVSAILLLIALGSLWASGRTENPDLKEGRSYIVVNYNGGSITDVWKLRKVVILNDPTFIEIQDQDGNVIRFKNGLKEIMLRQENSPLWDQYVEYHADLEPGVFYEDKLLKASKNK